MLAVPVESRRRDALVRDRLGPYEIAGQIGSGGMGEVYRATDINLKRQVALKVLPEAARGRRRSACALPA